MKAGDAGSLLGLFGDPGFMAAFDSPPFDKAQMDWWVERNLEHQSEYGYGLWIVELRHSGEVIGDCGLQNMHISGNAEVELGYDLRRDQWGRGLATEAATAALRYAFETQGLKRLVSLVRTSNAASARVAEKIGMRRERALTLDGVSYSLFAAGSTPL